MAEPPRHWLLDDWDRLCFVAPFELRIEFKNVLVEATKREMRRFARAFSYVDSGDSRQELERALAYIEERCSAWYCPKCGAPQAYDHDDDPITHDETDVCFECQFPMSVIGRWMDEWPHGLREYPPQPRDWMRTTAFT